MQTLSLSHSLTHSQFLTLSLSLYVFNSLSRSVLSIPTAVFLCPMKGTRLTLTLLGRGKINHFGRVGWVELRGERSRCLQKALPLNSWRFPWQLSKPADSGYSRGQWCIVGTCSGHHTASFFFVCVSLFCPGVRASESSVVFPSPSPSPFALSMATFVFHLPHLK